MSDTDLGARLLAAVHEVAGEHPGHRALHATGVGVTGRFVAGDGAGSLTTAVHLQPGVETPVTARFSNGSGDPAQADAVRDGRGFATKFHLPDGSSTDLVALTLPVFFVRTPEDFLTLMKARVPDPVTGEMDLAKVFAFLGEHPEAQRAAELSVVAPTPASYATTRYFAIHAYWLIGADGARHKIRFHWEPEAGVETLADDEASGQDARYLRAELADRLAGAPVTFRLVLTMGTDEDDETDPTVEWPAERDTLVAGRLELTGLAAEPDTVEAMIFDPTRVIGGIECSGDQILLARAAAYGASYAHRSR